MPKFEVVSEYTPSGDQPEAIEALSNGIEMGLDEQTLLGVTGSGKTFTMAKIIEKVQRPTLVLAHNKTLAAQLCAEFREFFPNNAVEYFVSYYDYYQPEAYIPHTDTFIEKDSAVNEEIDRLRLSATASLLERRDVIVVSSVSCIYGLGEPEDFAAMMVALRVGMTIERDELLKRLVAIRYERNDIAFERNMFRVRGDTVEVWPAYWKDTALRIEFFGDEIDRISEINVVTGTPIRRLNNIPIWPATHYVTPKEKMDAAIQEIYKELEERVAFFEKEGKLIEAQRIKQRTMYDIEMMQELGYCSGIENYSRVIEGRPVGSPPHTLLDYFPKDFVLFIDESHVTLPQVRAMYNGDRARKTTLVDYGFRLPCAFDNRPLKFEEFEKRLNQVVYVPAAPGEYTRRAFLNGKLSLTQAEAVMDIISADGRQGAALANASLNGALARKIAAQKDALTALQAHLAAWVDFPEEDVPALEPEALSAALSEVRAGLTGLIENFGAGAVLREGVDAAIVGSPNVGKSTLLNLLAGFDRAIVTPIAGTTRDVVEQAVMLGGVRVTLRDTAGLRRTGDVVEAEGIRRSRRAMEEAGLVLAVFDGSAPLTEEDKQLAADCAGRPAIAIVNKSDLPQKLDPAALAPRFSEVVTLAAGRGEGAETLGEAVRRVLGVANLDPSAPCLVSRRQYAAACEGRAALEEAENALDGGFGLDAVSVCVDDALSALCRLTGEDASDAVVEEVFSTFCVGK